MPSRNATIFLILIHKTPPKIFPNAHKSGRILGKAITDKMNSPITAVKKSAIIKKHPAMKRNRSNRQIGGTCRELIKCIPHVCDKLHPYFIKDR